MIGASELSDYKITLPELKEIFNLIALNGVFFYAEYVMEIDPKTRAYFSKLNLSDGSRLAESSLTNLDHNRSIDPHDGLGSLRKGLNGASSQPSLKAGQLPPGHKTAPGGRGTDPAVVAARAKIEQFMISQDVALSVLFSVIDTNSDNKLSRPEFKQKMRGLHMGLAEEELEALFRDLDANNDGAIAYTEFIEQFAAINTAQIIQRMRRILYGASISAEYIYNQHCAGGLMARAEFKNLLTSLIGKLADYEITSIFRELDRANAGSIPKDRFLDWFGFDEQEKLFQVGIEDIIKPLVTYMHRKNLNVVDLFAKYD